MLLALLARGNGLALCLVAPEGRQRGQYFFRNRNQASKRSFRAWAGSASMRDRHGGWSHNDARVDQ